MRIKRLFKKRTDEITAETKFLVAIETYQETNQSITKGKYYRVFAEFDTVECETGKCVVVLSDEDNFVGFDVSFFIDPSEYEGEKFGI